jgi:hypothetical protein
MRKLLSLVLLAGAAWAIYALFFRRTKDDQFAAHMKEQAENQAAAKVATGVNEIVKLIFPQTREPELPLENKILIRGNGGGPNIGAPEEGQFIPGPFGPIYVPGVMMN